ncbi:UDP-GlcNAc:undecaprenyl-phosphate GlcNAc-1-phosphate transferase [Pseudidiomarina indica]|uniref:Undecaprenyl-phosphate alpha-N-acetylglucosaminyl 1-phosphate transferase n=1 Tax=Pseudidiomarina indica TaxID=1159017 RepID=A0A1G6AUC9_9GAMM|nr:UDP-N-acetylglucosamine--undecaprenyl-phosphate N-acetylglucosaminephosphotransferase [Pseudidiomarina indica]SDB11994.1 UDP-GlcNAc:undecaprenyl-phosphate GlcNAc-1-phosphate transferase [Pseudidiomarina indica]
MDAWLIMLSAFLLSSFLSWGLIPVAWKVGLVDKPCERKKHVGSIPLVGGIAVFAATVIVFLTYFHLSLDLVLFIVASTCMVAIGVIDDRCDLSVRLRIVAQLAVASLIVFGSGTYISSLGNLFGLGVIDLGIWGYPFTLLAIMAAMNAYNMVDGIDGLLGLLATIAFFGIALLGVTHNQTFTVISALVITCALVPFLMRNVGFPVKTARKIFMGDAGSMFIGLAIVWLLALLTNTSHISDSGTSVRPVAVLWLIAVPIMDMLAIMVRRIYKRQSPFKPDRNHLHHIFLNAGCDTKQTLGIIGTYALSLLALGMLLEWLMVPEVVVLTVFFAVFAVYCYTINSVGYVTKLWAVLTRLF